MLSILLKEMMQTTNIDINRLHFAVMPFGSGNDLARCLNWGCVATDEPFLQSLAETINQVLNNADTLNLNIWKVTVAFFNSTEASIQAACGTGLSETLATEGTFKALLCNYLGLGEHAKVGIKF